MAAQRQGLGPTTDIGHMWEIAVQGYKEEIQEMGNEGTMDKVLGSILHKESGKKPPNTFEHEKFLDAKAVFLSLEKDGKLFNSFRHEGGIREKIRSSLSACADAIDKAGKLAAGVASTVFAPAPVIMSAMTLLLQAAKDVSDDYDVVVIFYDNATALLSRVGLLENRVPERGKFKDRLVDVFRSILELCVISQKFIKKNRWKAWAKAVLSGGDPRLKNAYDGFERSVRHLESDVAVHTLTTAIETKQTLDEISASMSTHFKGNIEVGSYLREMRDHGREMRDHGREIRKMMERFPKNIPGSICEVEYDPGARKSLTLGMLRRGLNAGDEALYHVDHRLAEMAASSLHYEEVFKWLHSDIDKLVRGEEQILHLKDMFGMGNPKVSFFMYNYLRERFTADSSTSVAYFFFDRQHSKLQSTETMLSCCAIQLARQDQDYQHKLLHLINGALPKEGVKGSWEKLFADFFKKPDGDKANTDGKKSLFIILDGIDEVPDPDVERLFDVLKKSKNSLVSFVVLGSPEANGPVRRLDLDMITDGRMSAYIKAGIKSSPVLSKFEGNFQDRIIEKLSRKADSSFYIDYFLHCFEKLQKSVVWRKLDDELFHNTSSIFDSLVKDLEHYQIEVAFYLLVWLAYVPGQLTVDSASSLFEVICQAKSSAEQDTSKENQVISRHDDKKESRRRSKPRRDGERPEREQGPQGKSKRVGKRPEKPEEQAGNESESLGLMSKAFDRTIVEIKRDGSQLLNSIVRVSEYDDVKGQSTQLTSDYSPKRSRSIVQFQEKFFVAPFRSQQVSYLVRMIEMTGSILTRGSDIDTTLHSDSGRSWRVVQAYSGRSWFQWFINLCDLIKLGPNHEEAIEDTDVRTVTVQLRDIMNNKGNALKRIESTVDADADGVYCSIFCTKRDELKSCLAKLRQWLKFAFKRLKEDPQTGTNQDGNLRQWMSKLAETETNEYMYNVLEDIARKHTDNWRSSPNTTDAWISFRFAYDALCSFPEDKLPGFLNPDNTQTITRNESSKVPNIVFAEIAERYKLPEETLGTQIYVAKALRYDGRYDEARKQLRKWPKGCSKGFEVLELIARYKFAKIEDDLLTREIHRPLEGSDRTVLQGALEAYNIALAQRDPNKAEHSNKAYQRKAWIEVLLKRTSDALETMANIADLNEHPIYYFAEMIEAMGENKQWENIIKLLKLLNGYTDALECSSKSLDFIEIAAAKDPEGSETKQHVQKWYEGEVEKRNEDSRTHQLLVSQANFQRFVLQDSEAAEKALLKALNSHSIGLQHIIPTVWNLGDALLDHFMLGETVADKHHALSKMEEVVEQVKHRMVLDFQPEFSQTSIPLAIMRRKLGPATSFEKSLNATFKACRAALEDDIWENDSESFRMLAKALSLLPGLESEAMIACSLQFYDMETAPSRSGKPFDWKVTCAACRCTISTADIEHDNAVKVYLCYYCTRVDLCKKCYDSRKERQERKNKGEEIAAGERPWREVCPLNNHAHIPAPINGWEMKREPNHFFSFNDRNQVITRNLKDWLKELDGKWDSAWKQYWLQH
ncbi:hypothetical protein B0J13DRAFT_138680 [Dactylonectria estremocensis]|uniref:Fungal STAND N-terminal Goodbye domain-containing protein n=1 Tax=Dactylonectria estremocensis TaxID=1079267 RepID=A0A9P9ISE6_9HYPO|nr:hypothetical protein B0J13DRAFT_138680 [Dactylonectria estremocensis]